jgi:hypothetical protein
MMESRHRSKRAVWTAAIDPHDVQVSPGSGRASMDVADLDVPDHHDFVNAVLLGPSLPSVVSFRVAWAASKDKHAGKSHFPRRPMMAPEIGLRRSARLRLPIPARSWL